MDLEGTRCRTSFKDFAQLRQTSLQGHIIGVQLCRDSTGNAAGSSQLPIRLHVTLSHKPK